MGEVSVVQGDITSLDVAVIVNAANEHLAHGGGVAAAIARAGAPDVQAESDAWIAEHGPVLSGQAAVTSAGGMPASSVVHVVGPRYREGQANEAMLRASVAAALDAAANLDARSIALPAISAGIYGYPREVATAVIADEVVRWLGAHPTPIQTVHLVAFDAATARDFEAGLAAAR